MSSVLQKGGFSKAGSVTATFTWPVVYSAVVHNGATLKNGTVIPPRPWTEVALQRFDVSEAFDRLMTQGLAPEMAFKQTALALGGEFQTVMTEEIFSWPRETVRPTGEVAGTTRNIVSRGLLRASQQLEFTS